MYSNIYIESDVREHPVVADISKRFPKAAYAEINRYTELFNRKNQDFRLQKQQPALILARKHDGFVLPAPFGYGVGGDHNFYFSTMLNCLYDCRYCFLQDMYSSANHVVFVNYEDFAEAIQRATSKFKKDEQVWLFSGYDCDSLALEPIVGMADYFMNSNLFTQNVWLELRTKSTQIRSMLTREPIQNVVTAFSFTPSGISKQIENKVPSVEKRLAAMLKLQERGWSVGLRFDPLIYSMDYKEQYRELFQMLFAVLNPDLVHSVSIGVFRLPKAFYKSLEQLFPDDRFVAQPFVSRGRQVSYPIEIESAMKQWCRAEIRRFMKDSKIFFAEIEVPVESSNQPGAQVSELIPS